MSHASTTRIAQTPWVLGILLLPALAMLPFVTQPGRAMLRHLFATPAPATVLPGFTVERAPSPAVGLIVTSLRSHSAAAQAGLLVGDNLEYVDGHPMWDVPQTIAYLRQDPRATVEVKLIHNHQWRTIMLPRTGDQIR